MSLGQPSTIAFCVSIREVERPAFSVFVYFFLCRVFQKENCLEKKSHNCSSTSERRFESACSRERLDRAKSYLHTTTDALPQGRHGFCFSTLALTSIISLLPLVYCFGEKVKRKHNTSHSQADLVSAESLRSMHACPSPSTSSWPFSRMLVFPHGIDLSQLQRMIMINGGQNFINKPL